MSEEGNNVHIICTPSKYMHKLSMSDSQGDSIGITMPGTRNDLTFYVCSGLLEHCLKSSCKLVVVGDTEIMGQDWKSNIHMKS